MTDLARFTQGAPIFAALGTEARLRILSKLTGGPLSITQLATDETVSRQAITKHLGVLAEAGLVRGVRSGRQHLWELDPAPLETARFCLDLVSQAWDQRLQRLRALVEDDPDSPRE